MPDVFDTVQNDLNVGLDGVFDVKSASYEQVMTTDPSADGLTAVAWRYHTTHVGVFMGLAATNRPVLIEGVTLASQGPDEWRLTRYIDWMSVAAQLGLTFSGRPVATPLPYELVVQENWVSTPPGP